MNALQNRLKGELRNQSWDEFDDGYRAGIRRAIQLAELRKTELESEQAKQLDDLLFRLDCLKEDYPSSDWGDGINDGIDRAREDLERKGI